MGFHQKDLTLKIRLLPDEARQEITDAFVQARCHRTRAAEALGCTLGTLISWIDRLNLREAFKEIEERAKKEGWHHGRDRLSPGRPKKKPVAAAKKTRGGSRRVA
jgi:hypothetical protein